jgi:hypothetical protein
LTNNGNRLLQEDYLIASDVLKELSLNQNFLRAKQRLYGELAIKKKLKQRQSAYFFKGILRTLKNNNQRLMKRR